MSMQDVVVVGVMPDGFVQSCNFVGVTNQGRPFHVPACQLLSMRDGRIAAVREYYDPNAFQRAFT
jgi:ketosteroid isomerase-like protein